ncbi:MAG: hypothetical protein U0105_26620 [Candidatus Obscuribacterales bacterium]
MGQLHTKALFGIAQVARRAAIVKNRKTGGCNLDLNENHRFSCIARFGSEGLNSGLRDPDFVMQDHHNVRHDQSDVFAGQFRRVVFDARSRQILMSHDLGTTQRIAAINCDATIMRFDHAVRVIQKTGC